MPFRSMERQNAWLRIPADVSKEDAIAAGKAALGDKLTGNVIKEIYVPGQNYQYCSQIMKLGKGIRFMDAFL